MSALRAYFTSHTAALTLAAVATACGTTDTADTGEPSTEVDEVNGGKTTGPSETSDGGGAPEGAEGSAPGPKAEPKTAFFPAIVPCGMPPPYEIACREWYDCAICCGVNDTACEKSCEQHHATGDCLACLAGVQKCAEKYGCPSLDGSYDPDREWLCLHFNCVAEWEACFGPLYNRVPRPQPCSGGNVCADIELDPLGACVPAGWNPMFVSEDLWGKPGGRCTITSEDLTPCSADSFCAAEMQSTGKLEGFCIAPCELPPAETPTPATP